MLPPHELPADVRLCGKLDVLDKLLVRLHAGGHKVQSVGFSALLLFPIRPYHTDGITEQTILDTSSTADACSGDLQVHADMRPFAVQCLVFCTMTRCLDVLEEYLQWRGFGYERLDGSTTAAARGAIVDSFNQPGDKHGVHCCWTAKIFD